MKMRRLADGDRNVPVVLVQEPLQPPVEAGPLEGVAEAGAAAAQEVVQAQLPQRGELPHQQLREAELVRGEARRVARVQVQPLQRGEAGQRLQLHQGLARGGARPGLGQVEVEGEAAAGVIKVERGHGELAEAGHQGGQVGGQVNLGQGS